jgi:hypothetical protein
MILMASYVANDCLNQSYIAVHCNQITVKDSVCEGGSVGGSFGTKIQL